MKKLAVFAVLGLFLSTAAFAEAIVLQNGKVTSYAQENIISLSGETSANVSYNGVKIIAPKGKKIQISKSRDGKILVNGTDLEGVELSNGKQFVRLTSQNKNISIVPSTLTVSDVEGNEPSEAAVVQTRQVKPSKNVNKQEGKAAKSTSARPAQTAQVAQQTVDFPEVSDFVNEVAVQQTAQDVTENPELSPSSPSSI